MREGILWRLFQIVPELKSSTFLKKQSPTPLHQLQLNLFARELTYRNRHPARKKILCG